MKRQLIKVFFCGGVIWCLYLRADCGEIKGNERAERETAIGNDMKQRSKQRYCGSATRMPLDLLKSCIEQKTFTTTCFSLFYIIVNWTFQTLNHSQTEHPTSFLTRSFNLMIESSWVVLSFQLFYNFIISLIRRINSWPCNKKKSSKLTNFHFLNWLISCLVH